jgi:hypothetical protein
MHPKQNLTEEHQRLVHLKQLCLVYSRIRDNGKSDERKKEGKSTTNPNIVFSADAHICWHKFANYFGIELREVGINSPTDYPLENIIKQIDENTIAVGAVLGTTYTGVIDKWVGYWNPRRCSQRWIYLAIYKTRIRVGF